MPREPKECCGSKGPTCKKVCSASAPTPVLSEEEQVVPELVEEVQAPRPVLTDTPTEKPQNVVYLEGDEAIIRNGEEVKRIYSREIHGEPFADLATQFAIKLNSKG